MNKLLPAKLQVQALGLQKVFGSGPQRVELFHELNLHIAPGERLAIIGASGVGKSTLLHILGTLDRPTAGKILFGDRDVLAWSDKDLARFRNRHIGFVFQF
ncbi:MAG TPA: ABC transporter ATP-binding protein, partial [Syntrophobacteraceae bacterium]|nr:ABC transporter ATP-binding protein [Syntrophobacteraceae bacterium]